MDSDFGNDEFFDGMDRQTARELDLSAGDESTDYSGHDETRRNRETIERTC
jgi:hypothetical protein